MPSKTDIIRSSERSGMKHECYASGSKSVLTVLVGKGRKSDDMQIETTETHCCIKFSDGSSWGCKLPGRVMEKETKVLYKEGMDRLIFQFLPKDTLSVWKSENVKAEYVGINCKRKVQINGGANGLESKSSVKAVNGFSKIESGVHSGSSSGTVSDKSEKANEKCAGEGDLNMKNAAAVATPSGDAVTTPPRPALPPKPKSVVPTNLVNGGSTAQTNEKVQQKKPVHQLKLIKFDYIEKDMDRIQVVIYVKKIDASSLKLHFGQQSFEIRFQTRDAKFLKLHDCSPDTTFIWGLSLAGVIEPAKCSHFAREVKLELNLLKKECVKWGCLEPRPVQSRTSPSSEEWQSLPNSNQRSTSEGISAPTKSRTEAKSQAAPMPPPPPVPAPAAPVPPPPPVPAPKSNVAPRISNDKHPQSGFDQLIADKAKKLSCSGEEEEDPVAAAKVGNRQPGTTGLDNIGNTCFMNSVLQVLSNCTELRDFFLSNKYSEDINKGNPLGYGGKLALQFADLLRHLWSGEHYSYRPCNLKKLVAVKISQFSGFAQHDSQEFMSFLLDGLHEDVNRILKKPTTETVESNGRPDQEVAEEAWQVHKKRNDSFIMELFQGQFKSKLHCPECHKESVTFDPFMYLSLPIPKPLISLTATFVSRRPDCAPTIIKVQVPEQATSQNFIDAASSLLNISAANLRLLRTWSGRVACDYTARNMVISRFSNGSLTLYEVDDAYDDSLDLILLQRCQVPKTHPMCCGSCRTQGGSQLRRCTKCYRVAYCNAECQRNNWTIHKQTCSYVPEPIGLPVCLRVRKKEASYSYLKRRLHAHTKMSTAVKSQLDSTPSDAVSSEISADTAEVQISSENSICSSGESATQAQGSVENEDGESCSQTKLEDMFKLINLHDGSPKKSSPITDLGDDPVLQSSGTIGLDWQNKDHKMHIENKDLSRCPDHPAVATPIKSKDLNVQHCLETFSEPEVLSKAEAWYCPHCKKHQEATKQMDIWKAPKYLVIQLKRFSYKSLIYRDKIDAAVDYPIDGLDMTKHVLDKSCGPQVYDLCGVIQHTGSIYGGHYVSLARCVNENVKKNIDWRLFDDSRVDWRPARLVSRFAYVLVYRRRNIEANITKMISSKAPLAKSEDVHDELKSENITEQESLIIETDEIVLNKPSQSTVTSGTDNKNATKLRNVTNSLAVLGVNEGVCELTASNGTSHDAQQQYEGTDMDAVD